MQSKLILRSLCLSVLGLLLLVPAALAQGDPQQQPPVPEQQAPAVEVSDQELEAVAKAYISVQQILADYQTRFNDIQDPEQAKEAQQQLAVEANEAIEAEGITPEMYDTVVRTAQVDEALRDRLVALIERLAEEDA